MPLAAHAVGKAGANIPRKPGDLPAAKPINPGGVSWWEWTDETRQRGAIMADSQHGI